jgi:hypothetical protein
MANLLVKVETSVPATLDHRVVIVHDDGSGTFQWYIGNSSNNPVKITPDVAAQPYDHTSIDDTDSPHVPSTDATRNFLLCDATNGVIEVNLPPSADWENQVITIKKRDTSANNVNINADAGDTIEGNGTVSLQNDYEYTSVYSDGNDVYEVSGNV